MKSIDAINFALFHHRHRDNISYEEFIKDYKCPSNLNKYFYKYHVNKQIKQQKISNMMITFFNVFDHQAAIILLFSYVKPIYYRYLKTFIYHLYKHDFIHLDVFQYFSIDDIDLVLLDYLESIKH